MSDSESEGWGVSKKSSLIIQKAGIELSRQSGEALSRYRSCHGESWKKMRYLLRTVTGFGP